jgi:Ca-activated chloride channel family protein
MLWLLLFALPPLIFFLWWSWRKRDWLIAQFVRSRLLAHLTVGMSKTRLKIRAVLLVAAVTCLIFALARPQWGFAWEEAKQRGRDIIVAIDTSRSMLAEDVAPNRLVRAKLAALDLAHRARTDRLGLVAFAGTAFLQCPLTMDEDAFRQTVDAVDVGIIPQGGTAIAEAIAVATETFKENKENDKALVIFTDGEDHDGGALEAAKRAAQTGVRIFTIGVGTAEGDLLRQRGPTDGSGFIKDADGNVVKSHLDETLLRELAAAAKGFYLPLVGANTIDLLYERGLAPLQERQIAERLVKRYHERFQWPLSLAIVLLLLEMFLPDRKLVRRPEQPPAHASIAGFEKVVALLALMAWPWAGQAASSGKALHYYQNGQYDRATQEYEQLLRKHPDDARLHFNAGAAAYQAGKFDDAGKDFNAALHSPDLPLQQPTFYNLGNTLYRLGEQAPDPSKKSEAWEESVKSYEAALQLDPHDADARFNLELVKKRLEELKKQQSQSQKSQDKNSNQQPKDQSQAGNSQQDQNQ